MSEETPACFEPKDPKDMTASELLRWAVEKEDRCCKWSESTLNEAMGNGRSSCLEAETILALAEKIDAELAGAHDAKLIKQMDWQIGLVGWPRRRDDEGIVQWMERCFLPRPRFEDGEPVQFGEGGLREIRHKWCYVPMAEHVMETVLAYDDGSEIEIDPGERVERPAPEVLLADGKPAKVGETVWLTDEGAAHVNDNDLGAYSLYHVEPNEALVVNSPLKSDKCVHIGYCGAWCPASWLTHEEPDSIGRIEADAKEHTFMYWCCDTNPCDKCPAMVDGRNPKERYGTDSCWAAMALDLLARQRAVIARGGAE